MFQRRRRSHDGELIHDIIPLNRKLSIYILKTRIERLIGCSFGSRDAKKGNSRA